MYHIVRATSLTCIWTQEQGKAEKIYQSLLMPWAIQVPASDSAHRLSLILQIPQLCFLCLALPSTFPNISRLGKHPNHKVWDIECWLTGPAFHYEWKWEKSCEMMNKQKHCAAPAQATWGSWKKAGICCSRHPTRNHRLTCLALFLGSTCSFTLQQDVASDLFHIRLVLLFCFGKIEKAPAPAKGSNSALLPDGAWLCT